MENNKKTKIVLAGRRTGKTTKMIEESSRLGSYILVASHQQAQSIAELARKLMEV